MSEFKWHVITTHTVVPFRFCERCVNFEQTKITEEECEGRCVNEHICMTTISLLLNNFPMEVDVDGVPCIYSLNVERRQDGKISNT